MTPAMRPVVPGPVPTSRRCEKKSRRFVAVHSSLTAMEPERTPAASNCP